MPECHLNLIYIILSQPSMETQISAAAWGSPNNFPKEKNVCEAQDCLVNEIKALNKGAKELHQWKNETLRLLQQMAPQNGALCFWWPFFLDTLKEQLKTKAGRYTYYSLKLKYSFFMNWVKWHQQPTFKSRLMRALSLCKKVLYAV